MNDRLIFLGIGIDLELVAIPSGEFFMGGDEVPWREPLWQYEQIANVSRPQHKVTVRPFYMSKYPITQNQWRAIAYRSDLKVERDINPNPSHFMGNNRPVENISWYDAIEFCARLFLETGKKYRLPSEAEWEYACRAGTTTGFSCGNTIWFNQANCDCRSNKGIEDGKTMPVGSYPPNAFGLYDMHGNVWEWCADDWHESYKGAPSDGSVWLVGGDEKISPLRGGSWYSIPKFCRSAYRSAGRRCSRTRDRGFRVVCEDC